MRRIWLSKDPKIRHLLIKLGGVSLALAIVLSLLVWLFLAAGLTGWIFYLATIAAVAVVIYMALIRTRMPLTDPEHTRALQSHQVLEIANQTLPYLRTGLDAESAKAVAEIVFKNSDAIAVALTDKTTVLAFKGRGSDHHQAGGAILTKATKETLKHNEARVVGSKREIGCPVTGCPLQAAIVVPLEFKEKPAGTLKFYYDKAEKLTEDRITVAKGLAKLLSTQLELSEIERQKELTCEAELKALRAQINPHFLFNTLNTIAAFCRTKPQKARRLLIQFAGFFRRSLERTEQLITLKEELDYINSYLVFERARFGKNLWVVEDIDPRTKDLKLPALVLQPLVENAVKHATAKHPLRIKISARPENSEMILIVEDNGAGISSEEIDKILLPGYGKGIGIGLKNVSERLKGLYGPNSKLEIFSQAGDGTKVVLRIPAEEGNA